MEEIRKIIMIPNRKIKYDNNNAWMVTQAVTFVETLVSCQEFGVLPRSGGLLDQDSYFVFLMRHAISCQRARAELDARQAK